MFLDKAQIKLAMLSLYSAFGTDVDAAYAQESIVATGMINVLDCNECERELVEEGLLYYTGSDGRACCGITEYGEQTVARGITLLDKRELDEFMALALRRFEYICSGRKYTTELTETDGGYMLLCALRSKERTFMEVKLFFDSKHEALQAYECCNKKPEIVFGGLKTILTGKLDHLL
jgi:hypothetical protein